MFENRDTGLSFKPFVNLSPDNAQAVPELSYLILGPVVHLCEFRGRCRVCCRVDALWPTGYPVLVGTGANEGLPAPAGASKWTRPPLLLRLLRV